MRRLALGLLAALLVGTMLPSPARSAPASGARDPRTLALVDQHGKRFRIVDLAGHPVAITFVATRCTDACPIASAMFSRLQARLRRDGTKATLLTVTLDPGFDSPFVMARYAREWDADARTWRFVSGDPKAIGAMMRALGVVAVKGKDGIPDEHSSFVYVLDARGRLTRTFMLSTNSVEDVARALRSPSVRTAKT
ncbi:MAG: SCO family protein [Candidatus Baltobacteraceae bacterium]